VSGLLTPELLLRAYASGVFPMAETRDSNSVFWVNPDRRGIIPLDRFHIPRRLMRTVRVGPFQIRCDSAFGQVISGCAAPAPGRRETWINRDILELYRDLHRMGFAHSVETWHGDRLVGGLYGVGLGSAFFGESMFSTERDASKVALIHLVARLRLGHFALLDTQFVTDHLAQFGTIEVSRSDYLRRLERALRETAQFPAAPDEAQLRDELERMYRQSRNHDNTR
jgi:leucyl/phenylalanyl-tRNA--protein transferase